MHEPQWTHWYMVAFFTLFGVSILRRGEGFAALDGLFCGPRRSEGELGDRLVHAYRRRQHNENLPSRTMGLIVGGTSLCAALIAATTQAPVVVLYAALTFVLAAVLTVAYARLERVEAPRVASLQVRDARAVAPLFVWILVGMTSFAPLLWLRQAPVAALLSTCAGAAIALLGYRVASTSTLLTGEDVAVERFIDDRLRTIRTVNLLATAVGPSFVFEALTGFTDSAIRVAAMLLALVALAVSLSLQYVLLRRRPSAAGIAASSPYA